LQLNTSTELREFSLSQRWTRRFDGTVDFTPCCLSDSLTPAASPSAHSRCQTMLCHVTKYGQLQVTPYSEPISGLCPCTQHNMYSW